MFKIVLVLTNTNSKKLYILKVKLLKCQKVPVQWRNKKITNLFVIFSLSFLYISFLEP